MAARRERRPPEPITPEELALKESGNDPVNPSLQQGIDEAYESGDAQRLAARHVRVMMNKGYPEDKMRKLFAVGDDIPIPA